MSDFREANRAHWDSRVPLHVDGPYYDVEAFLAGSPFVRDVDAELLGDISDKRVVQLQCHFGMEIIDLGRRGARVAGLDFSPKAIEAAQSLAKRAGVEARFVQGDVCDAASLLGETYDIVFVTVGSICWLPELEPWAEQVSQLLERGGFLYLRDTHPMLWVIDDQSPEPTGFKYRYFPHPEDPDAVDDSTTYGGEGEVVSARHYSWAHSLSEIVNALAGAGLHIERLEEHRFVEYQALPCMTRGDDGWWRLPPALADKIPLSLSLIARQPTE